MSATRPPRQDCGHVRRLARDRNRAIHGRKGTRPWFGAAPAAWLATIAARRTSAVPVPDTSKGLAAGVGASQDPASLGRLTASFLIKPKGPRVAMLETLGWDTHNAQKGRLANQLKNLDAMLADLRDSLGTAWANTTVLVATEFGRTVAIKWYRRD